MKINKAKIIVILGILVLSVLAGLLIRISLRGQQSKSEQAFAPIKSEESTLKNPALRFPSAKGLEELNIPLLPITKPNLKVSQGKSSPSMIAPFFENINKAVKAVEKSLTSNNAAVQNISTTTSAGIILSLTKDQFHFLYPDIFIASLVDAQTFLIKEYYPDYQLIFKIETDGQVRFIEEKIVATLLLANMITKERAEQLVTTIRFTLPELQLIDLKRYNSYGIYEYSPFKEPRQPVRLFLADLMEKLADALAHKARAICGYCYDLPECYQEGEATSGRAGSEVVKPFCYCTGCYSSLGCLSSYNGQAAIFDEQTGICGAGK